MKKSIQSALIVGTTIWCLGILSAPLLGWSWLYDLFAVVCHQDPARSWHVEGEPLPVCIRCASIYFAFAVSLWLGLRVSMSWLRISLLFMGTEFLIARLVFDDALLRSLSGVLLGLSAAPFIRQAFEEIRDAM